MVYVRTEASAVLKSSEKVVLEPPPFHSTAYLRSGVPPLSAGATHPITICEVLADVLVGTRGVPGLMAAMITASPEKGLKPTSFLALTLKLYSSPVTRFNASYSRRLPVDPANST